MRYWTMMVYMAGDNGHLLDEHGKPLMSDLVSFGWRDLAEMAEVGSTDQVAVVAQFDTLTEEQHTPRFYMDGTRPCGQLVEKVPPVNTGDPRNLTEFIVWGATHYPAERYALVLWNHGSGWKEDDVYARYREKVDKAVRGGEVRAGSRGARVLRGSLFLSTAGEIMGIEDDEVRAICYDDSSMDFLDNAEMVKALRDAEEQTGKKISLLGMDACLMSMVEVAYQLRNEAAVMVGSQENEPGAGWPYTDILRALVDEPDMSPQTLGQTIVRAYGSSYGLRGGRSVTQSAITLDKMGDLGERIGVLAKALAERYNDDFLVERAVGRALKNVQRFSGDKDYIDLYDFVDQLESWYDGEGPVADAIASLQAAMPEPRPDAPVLANVKGSRHKGAHGLSIYFPSLGCSQYYEDIELANLGWRDLVRTVNAVQD
jgi:hypothetical protein